MKTVLQLRLATLLLQASIETLLAFMHHFPLFALMLRGKDPQRLPGKFLLSVISLYILLIFSDI